MQANSTLEIGALTDEISRDLAEAFEIGARWDLTRFELREGVSGRFPNFTEEEIRVVEEARRAGARITAVSPGILKGHLNDEARLKRELEEILPRALELGARFEAPLIIVFGFERYEGEAASNRTRAMRIFERVAVAAENAGMNAAVENEPGFWIDRAESTAGLLDEIGHPALGTNWDPANSYWGGHVPTYEDFRALRPHMVNVHVKDLYSDNPDEPWLPVGEGEIPWPELLSWINSETELEHVTLETHCTPLEESSRRSIESLRRILSEFED